MEILKDNYLITINGTMEQRGESDSVKLMTRGNFTKRNGTFFISYEESEVTGYGGCKTMVKVDEDGRGVSMIRYGKMQSQLIIEKGTRHVCHYDMGMQSVSLGVCADEIITSLTESGGNLKFSYLLDTETMPISHNTVDITVEKVN